MEHAKPAAEKMLPPKRQHLFQLMVLLSTLQVIYTVPVDLNCLSISSPCPHSPHTPFYINSCRTKLLHKLLQSLRTHPQQGTSGPGWRRDYKKSKYAFKNVELNGCAMTQSISSAVSSLSKRLVPFWKSLGLKRNLLPSLAQSKIGRNLRIKKYKIIH